MLCCGASVFIVMCFSDRYSVLICEVQRSYEGVAGWQAGGKSVPWRVQISLGFWRNAAPVSVVCPRALGKNKGIALLKTSL